MLKLLFSNLMSGKVGDVFILIWRISDLLQSHIWFDKGSIMLTFFHEVMQPDSNGVIAVRKHWCPTKSHLIDPANKDRCRVSPRRGKENNLQTLVEQVFGPRPLSPSLMIPLGNDALQGDTGGSPVSRRTYTRLVAFEMMCGTLIGVKTGTGTPPSSLTKGKNKPGPDIYTARFTDTAHYILYTAYCCL